MVREPDISPEEADKIERANDGEFYKLVGECITTWAGIESKIFRIFRLFLHTDRQFAAILFFRAPSLDARFSTVGEIIAAAFPKTARKNGGHDHPLVIEWAKIRQRSISLVKFRNALAHQQVSRRDGEIQVRYSENESWRGTKPSIETIKRGDLTNHQKELTEFFKQVTDYMHEIKAVLPAEPLQQEFRRLLGLSPQNENPEQAP